MSVQNSIELAFNRSSFEIDENLHQMALAPLTLYRNSWCVRVTSDDKLEACSIFRRIYDVFLEVISFLSGRYIDGPLSIKNKIISHLEIYQDSFNLADLPLIDQIADQSWLVHDEELNARVLVVKEQIELFNKKRESKKLISQQERTRITLATPSTPIPILVPSNPLENQESIIRREVASSPQNQPLPVELSTVLPEIKVLPLNKSSWKSISVTMMTVGFPALAAVSAYYLMKNGEAIDHDLENFGDPLDHYIPIIIGNVSTLASSLQLSAEPLMTHASNVTTYTLMLGAAVLSNLSSLPKFTFLPRNSYPSNLSSSENDRCPEEICYTSTNFSASTSTPFWLGNLNGRTISEIYPLEKLPVEMPLVDLDMPIQNYTEVLEEVSSAVEPLQLNQTRGETKPKVKSGFQTHQPVLQVNQSGFIGDLSGNVSAARLDKNVHPVVTSARVVYQLVSSFRFALRDLSVNMSNLTSYALNVAKHITKTGTSALAIIPGQFSRIVRYLNLNEIQIKEEQLPKKLSLDHQTDLEISLKQEMCPLNGQMTVNGNKSLSAFSEEVENPLILKHSALYVLLAPVALVALSVFQGLKDAWQQKRVESEKRNHNLKRIREMIAIERSSRNSQTILQSKEQPLPSEKAISKTKRRRRRGPNKQLEIRSPHTSSSIDARNPFSILFTPRGSGDVAKVDLPQNRQEDLRLKRLMHRKSDIVPSQLATVQTIADRTTSTVVPRFHPSSNTHKPGNHLHQKPAVSQAQLRSVPVSNETTSGTKLVIPMKNRFWNWLTKSYTNSPPKLESSRISLFNPETGLDNISAPESFSVDQNPEPLTPRSAVRARSPVTPRSPVITKSIEEDQSSSSDSLSGSSSESDDAAQNSFGLDNAIESLKSPSFFPPSYLRASPSLNWRASNEAIPKNQKSPKSPLPSSARSSSHHLSSFMTPNQYDLLASDDGSKRKPTVPTEARKSPSVSFAAPSSPDIGMLNWNRNQRIVFDRLSDLLNTSRARFSKEKIPSVDLAIRRQNLLDFIKGNEFGLLEAQIQRVKTRSGLWNLVTKIEYKIFSLESYFQVFSLDSGKLIARLNELSKQLLELRKIAGNMTSTEGFYWRKDEGANEKKGLRLIRKIVQCQFNISSALADGKTLHQMQKETEKIIDQFFLIDLELKNWVYPLERSFGSPETPFPFNLSTPSFPITGLSSEDEGASSAGSRLPEVSSSASRLLEEFDAAADSRF